MALQFLIVTPERMIGGLQVAACICLFSLDKHEAIPVDTHVWQLATKFYTPGLKGEVKHQTHEVVHHGPSQ